MWLWRGLIKYNVTYATLKIRCLFVVVVNDDLPSDGLGKHSHCHVKVFQNVQCHIYNRELWLWEELSVFKKLNTRVREDKQLAMQA